MNFKEIKEITDPFQTRLLKAAGQLSDIEKKQEPDVAQASFIIESRGKVTEFQAKLNGIHTPATDSKGALKFAVLQLNKQLDDILSSLQLKGYAVNF